MTPYQYVWTLLETHLEKNNGQWAALANMVDMSENTLRYSISNETARHRTLFNIVYKLEGLLKSYDFLLEFDGELKGLATETRIAENHKANLRDTSSDVLERKMQEILMLTGSSEGIDYSELISQIPHRKKSIDELINSGFLENKDGVIYGSYGTKDPDMSVKKINIKTDIVNNSDDKFRDGTVLTLDDKIDSLGFQEMKVATDEYFRKVYDIIKKRKSRTGISFTLATMLTSLGLSEQHKKELIRLGEDNDN